MKIIVTGGAGFLGSNLCEKLVSLGEDVLSIDNFLTSDGSNIVHLKINPHFRFLKYDVSKPLPDDLSADQIYHLASPASPNIHSLKNYHNLPFETMLVNSQGTWNLCEFALRKQAKFLFASTSEVYGDPLEHPQKEDYRGNVSSIGPRSVYDEAKRFGETIVSAFVRSKGLDGRIVRIFNTYGPKMALDDGRAVIEFVSAALKNQPLKIFGSGKQTRSFMFVSDLVDGLIKMMNSDQTKGEVVNLGNPDEFTILKLAEIIKRLTNSKSEIIFTDSLPQDDPLKRKPDISKAKKLLDWEPKISLEEGLSLLVNSLQDSVYG